MDCQIQGRTKPQSTPLSPLDYGLDGMTPGQMKFAYAEARQYLENVMMDPKAPAVLTQLIREQNAFGLLVVQNLLAGFWRKMDQKHGE